LDTDDRDIAAACRRLHSAIDAMDQAAADLLGISRNDLRCLNLLEHGPLPPTRIAAALGLTSGSVTALVDRLERRGLIERSRDPADRRGVRVSATPAVFESIGAHYRACADRLVATVARYPAAERAAAIAHLNDVAAAWEDSVPPTDATPRSRRA
jgi:DNA-binding MarR family transcriptional regulator